MQKHRIHTNVGGDQKINVEIKQDYDLMEILSLKFSQKDVYSSGSCAEYGVVVGRVSANNGFGIPNAKVSIFIPLLDIDEEDPVISGLYPYKSVIDRDSEGYRYNLLPSRQQHPGHAPTGTFMDQQDILTREECLEVFETYYSFTVKTNSSGDFMIWGVPIGVQTIHIDVDLSDIGCFSLRPYDFIKKGAGLDNFERYYSFKSSVDIDGLPQIVSFNKTIEVYPFWGSEELCEIGITRTDFDLSEKGIKIEPIALILLSSITDDTGDAVKRNGKIRKNTGYKCNLQTTGGKIECVRQTGGKVLGSDGITIYPELEFFNVSEVIDEAGIAMVVLPMNMEYTYTNEFGEEETTNDKNKGIPTTTTARFRFSLDFDSKKVTTAKYLVPNIREFNPNSTGVHNNNEYSEAMVASYQFSDVFEDYLTPQRPSNVTLTSTSFTSLIKDHKKDLMLGTYNAGIPEDYFYKFIYGKVYTVSSFQGTHYETARRDAFLGIKQIRPNIEEDCASKTNYFPTNFAFKNRTKFALILSQVLLYIQFIFSVIMIKFAEMLGRFFYGLSRLLYNIGIRRWRPFRKISQQFEDNAYGIQDKYTMQLPLTIYPDCEECTSDSESQILDASFVNDYCRVAEFKVKVDNFNSILSHGHPCDYNMRRTVVLHGNSGGFRNLDSQVSFLSNNSIEENNIFPGEAARDIEGQCVNSQSIVYGDLVTLDSEVISPAPPDYTTSRYIAAVYPYVDGWGATVSGATIFSEFLVFFNNSVSDDVSNAKFHTINLPACAGTLDSDVFFGRSTATGVDSFSYDEWNELTGMDFDTLPAHAEAYTYAIIRIYDRYLMKTSGETSQDLLTEVGCYKYDKTYNEEFTFGYIWSTGSTYEPLTQPANPSGIPGSNWLTYADAPGFREYAKTITPASPYVSLMSTIIGRSNTLRMPYKKAYTKIPNTIYDRKTKSGLSEFRDGMFTLIPVIKGSSYNLQALQEWYKRKRVGLMFCGGVINYSFIDNWLNGVLYFFKFDKRLRWDNETNFDLNQRGSKYPRELIFYNVLDKVFYYRSTPYYMNTFTGQLYSGDQEILHPTTFYDVGVRDEFLYEICTDPNIDPTCSVVRDITATSYQDPANILEYAINYRLDSTAGKFDVDDFFSRDELGSNIKVLDGDISQLMSINCEAGIEGFDLDTPHYYMYNGDMMDPESGNFGTYFKSGTNFGPSPIDLKFDNDGKFIRSCLNYSLGDFSQKVPFYLWDKSGTGLAGSTTVGIGFGSYGDDSDKQRWDKTGIASMKLQRLFSVSGITFDNPTNYIIPNGEEKYLLKPITITHNSFSFLGAYEDMLERFEVISYSAPVSVIGYIEGDLWLKVTSGSISNPQSGNLYVVVNGVWALQPDDYFDNYRETFVPQTITNYMGNKQVLSTPFLFYFGLKPEKTSLDLLIKYFGPKDAFISEDTGECVDLNATPTPTPVPTLTLVPTPTAAATPTPTPTPVVTLTPTETIYYYHLSRCIDNVDTYYALHSSSRLYPGDAVYGSVWCDPNYLYVVVGYTTVESDYISAGYQAIGQVSQDVAHTGCIGCDGGQVVPAPTALPYTLVNLVRNTADMDPAGSTCGNVFYNATRKEIGYIQASPIVPHTGGYVVYTDATFLTPFTPSSLYWGIKYDNNITITHTVYIGANGALSDWTNC